MDTKYFLDFLHYNGWQSVNQLWRQSTLVTEVFLFRQISRCVLTRNETEKLNKDAILSASVSNFGEKPTAMFLN